MEEFIAKMYRAIGNTTASNCLKIRNYIAFKEEDKGYNYVGVCQEFISYCLSNMTDSNLQLNCAYIAIASAALNAMALNGKKEFKFDLMLLDLRKAYRKYGDLD